MSQTPNSPEQRALDYVAVTNGIIQRVQSDQAEKVAQDEKIAALIPSVVASLVKNERIGEEQAEKVAEALTNPVHVLELLRDVAQHRNADELTKIGSAVGRDDSSIAASRHRPVGAPTPRMDDTPEGARFRQQIMGGRQ